MSSKFANLLSQARNRPSDETELEVEQGSAPTVEAQEVEPPPIVAPPVHKAKAKPAKANAPVRRKSAAVRIESEAPNTAEGAVRGRPRTGKRSDPNYIQITAYIRKDTHRDVKLALLQEDGGREISEVVEQQLVAWLEKQK